jgi:hypothetical protein
MPQSIIIRCVTDASYPWLMWRMLYRKACTAEYDLRAAGGSRPANISERADASIIAVTIVGSTSRIFMAIIGYMTPGCAVIIDRTFLHPLLALHRAFFMPIVGRENHGRAFIIDCTSLHPLLALHCTSFAAIIGGVSGGCASIVGCTSLYPLLDICRAFSRLLLALRPPDVQLLLTA